MTQCDSWSFSAKCSLSSPFPICFYAHSAEAPFPLWCAEPLIAGAQHHRFDPAEPHGTCALSFALSPPTLISFGLSVLWERGFCPSPSASPCTFSARFIMCWCSLEWPLLLCITYMLLKVTPTLYPNKQSHTGKKTHLIHNADRGAEMESVSNSPFSGGYSGTSPTASLLMAFGHEECKSRRPEAGQRT